MKPRIHVSQEGKTTYTYIVRLKGHPTQSATFARKRDGERWVEDTKSAIRQGRHFKTAEARKKTLAELIDKFKVEELPNLRGDSAKVITHLDWWKKRLGPYFLCDITPVKISELKGTLRNEPTKRGSERSNYTINRYLSSLSICFSYAVQEIGWVEVNPVKSVRKVKEPRGRERFLTTEEQQRLLDAAAKDVSPHIYPIIFLALSTGMRSSEITHLQWKDLDLKRRVITLEKTKNGDKRSLPISTPTYEMFLDLNKVRRLNTNYIFPQEDGKKPFKPRGAWLRVTKKAKLTDFRFHDLRHTAASNLAHNGATLLELAQILGHRTLAMVKRYAHLTEQHTVNILEKMNTETLKYNKR